MASHSDTLRYSLDTIMQERSVSRAEARRILIDMIDRRRREIVAEGRAESIRDRLLKPNPWQRAGETV